MQPIRGPTLSGGHVAQLEERSYNGGRQVLFALECAARPCCQISDNHTFTNTARKRTTANRPAQGPLA